MTDTKRNQPSVLSPGLLTQTLMYTHSSSLSQLSHPSLPPTLPLTLTLTLHAHTHTYAHNILLFLSPLYVVYCAFFPHWVGYYFELSRLCRRQIIASHFFLYLHHLYCAVARVQLYTCTQLSLSLSQCYNNICTLQRFTKVMYEPKHFFKCRYDKNSKWILDLLTIIYITLAPSQVKYALC